MNANWPHVRRIRVSAAAKLPKNRCFPGVRSGRARRLGEIPILIFHPAENATGPGTPASADVSLLHAVPGAPLQSGRESAIHRRGFSAGPACPPPSRSLAESADSRRVAPIVRRYAVAEPGPTAAMYWRPSSPLSGDISQAELALQFLKRDHFAAREFGIAFANRRPIRIAQWWIAAAFRQKMQEAAGQGPVGFRDHVDQAVEFFVSSHVSIVDGKAVR